MEHTKEPWFFKKRCVSSFDIQRDHGVNQIEQVANAITEANARRIVTCVNALAHISTEELETWNMQNLVIRMRDAEQQRDELLEALKFILERIEIPDRNCSCHISPPCGDCVDNSGIREAVEFAQAAIAKAEA